MEHLTAHFVLEPTIRGSPAHKHACGTHLHLRHGFHPYPLCSHPYNREVRAHPHSRTGGDGTPHTCHSVHTLQGSH
jgi:hypothetical protein